MRTAIWTEHFTEHDIEDTVEFVGSIGYDAVAITPWRHDLTEDLIERIDAAVERNGLNVAGLARMFHPDSEISVTSPLATDRERARNHLEEMVALCDALGGGVLPFGAGDQRTYPEEIGNDAAREYALEVFGHDSLLERLETHGVSIGIEPLSKSATNFLNTTPETVEFVEAIDHPNVGVTIDGYHLVNESDPIPDLIRECQNHLVEFHADDPRGLGPGSGDLDFKPILATLEEVGFDGYHTVEFHAFLGDEKPDDDPRALAERSVEYLVEARQS